MTNITVQSVIKVAKVRRHLDHKQRYCWMFWGMYELNNPSQNLSVFMFTTYFPGVYFCTTHKLRPCHQFVLEMKTQNAMTMM